MAINYETDSQYYNPRQAKTQAGNANGNGQAVGSNDTASNQSSVPGYDEQYSPAGNDATPTPAPTGAANNTTGSNTGTQNRDTYAGAGTPDWVKWQLGLVNSTDDANYWITEMAKDPKVAAGDRSAIDYWIDRIRRGDGSELVRNGTLQLYGGGAAGNGDAASGGSFMASPYASSLWEMLMKRANQSLNVNSKDPIIAGQTNAYRAEQTRGMRNNLAQAAEAGGPEANLSMERRMGNEQVAQSTGNLESQLMSQELTARRAEITQALTEMGSFLTDEQRLSLQRELALLNNGLEQQRINNQNNQFKDQLGLQVTDRANYWDAIRSGLIGG